MRSLGCVGKGGCTGPGVEWVVGAAVRRCDWSRDGSMPVIAGQARFYRGGAGCGGFRESLAN